MQKRTIIGTLVILALLAWYFSSFGWILFVPFLILLIIAGFLLWFIPLRYLKGVEQRVAALGLKRVNDDEFEGTYKGFSIKLSFLPDTKEAQGPSFTYGHDVDGSSRIVIQKKFSITAPIRINFKRKLMGYSDGVALDFEDKLLVRGKRSDVNKLISKEVYVCMQTFVQTYAPSKLYAVYPLFIITPTSITFHRLSLSKIKSLQPLMDDLIDLVKLFSHQD